MKQQTLWTRALTSTRTRSSEAWSIFKYEFIELNWHRWYALKSYVMSALWIVPFVAVVIEMVLVRLSAAVGDWLVASGTMSPATVLVASATAGVRSMLETIITATLSFLVFTFGSLLVAIQVAGGQYTPRVIATIFLRDNVVRSCVGLFVVTLLFAMRTLRMMGDTVHQLNAFLSACFGLLSIVTFLFLIDYAARMLRPVSIVARVGESGLAVIKSVYPEQSSRPRTHEPSRKLPPPDRVVVHAGASGAVLAVNLKALVAQARQAGGIIEFVPQIGDFLAADEALFRLYGGASGIDERQLRAEVAIGTERTMEQDPTFAFRILVDIAIKALSAAINDPTTAVLAIDQLHRLLRRVGLQDLRGDEICDEAGKLRLILRTPNWEDFVHLACTEIRHCGTGSIQVVRRMRSLLENLMQTLPPHRHAELRQQLALLDRSVAGHYKFPEDLALARITDSQGLGGGLGVQPVSEAQTADGGEHEK
ncbi:MAG: DUF2254 domain-containing protein [Propionivibrio sp.]|uniref:DUF2254 domain-containing protein n=1 Tax=Propionivibrio sp. TaxID=2212460 RepID=UPI001A4DEAF0|nr:DUF2254 domain-containing protein [Propionivibrio sp.]MBL8415061.1 DUF2254 domain-containing protein [Propionivibrio sp.]